MKRRWIASISAVGGTIVIIIAARLIGSLIGTTVGNSVARPLANAIVGVTPHRLVQALQPFSSEDGRFIVTSPVAFATAESTVPSALGPLKQTIFSGTDADTFYAVIYADYPSSVGTADPQQMLDGGTEGLVKAAKGKLTTEKKITVAGYPGRDLLIASTTNGAEYTFRMRAILVKNRMYVLETVAVKATDNLQKADAFMSSFALR